MLEANLALRRRYFSHHAQRIIGAQNNLAICLTSLARHDEALKLKREIYASSVALQGVSSEQTLLLGSNLVNSLINQKHWDEAISLARDQLLPAARESLGADHELMLRINHTLAGALVAVSESPRDNLRLNQRAASTRPISTQATFSKPRPSCMMWSRGDCESSVRRIRTRASRKTC